MTGRRFIAGAVCPACGQMDSILVEPDAADSSASTSMVRRRCVDCGFTDRLNDVVGSAEPKARFMDARGPVGAETPVQPVRLLPASSNKNPPDAADS